MFNNIQTINHFLIIILFICQLWSDRRDLEPLPHHDSSVDCFNPKLHHLHAYLV